MARQRTVARLRFTAPFRYTPSAERRICIKYRAGWSGPVNAECARLALAAGVAVKIPREPAPCLPDRDASA